MIFNLAARLEAGKFTMFMREMFLLPPLAKGRVGEGVAGNREGKNFAAIGANKCRSLKFLFCLF